MVFLRGGCGGGAVGQRQSHGLSQKNAQAGRTARKLPGDKLSPGRNDRLHRQKAKAACRQYGTDPAHHPIYPLAEGRTLPALARRRERIEETIDPEQAIDRALETYQKKGYDADWIHQRILSIRVRNELTAEWQARGVEQGREYAILTDEITKAWSGMTTRQYKNLKGLKKENLRDNMSTTEIILNMLAETSTKDISKKERPEGFSESMKVARRGGKVASIARTALEAETGEPVITSQNAAQLNTVVTDMIEGVAEADKPNGDEK